jgi:hypothetical protein
VRHQRRENASNYSVNISRIIQGWSGVHKYLIWLRSQGRSSDRLRTGPANWALPHDPLFHGVAAVVYAFYLMPLIIIIIMPPPMPLLIIRMGLGALGAVSRTGRTGTPTGTPRRYGNRHADWYSNWTVAHRWSDPATGTPTGTPTGRSPTGGPIIGLKSISSRDEGPTRECLRPPLAMPFRDPMESLPPRDATRFFLE